MRKAKGFSKNIIVYFCSSVKCKNAFNNMYLAFLILPGEIVLDKAVFL